MRAATVRPGRGCLLVRQQQARRFSQAVCFPGQGTQRAGQLGDIYRRFPSETKEIVDVVAQLDAELADALVNEDSKFDVKSTVNTQPFVLAYGYAVYKVLSSRPGFIARYFAGHSLGEYTALTAAGVLDFATALKVVRQRGVAMHNATQQYAGDTVMVTLLVIRHSAADVVPVARDAIERNGLGGKVAVAIIGGPAQFVLSGDKEGVELVCTELKKKFKFKTKPLEVSGPFHSPIMEPGKKTMREILGSIELNWPHDVEVVSNITGKPFESLDEVKYSIENTLTEPVNWLASMEYLDKHASKIWSIGETKYVSLGLPKNASAEVILVPESL
ncbi:hypothetical protein TRVA0_015S02366 [Trichomonascus vanleenenianus]|uniref:ACP S-malonyltransferase n=1 Tax=Trichomonascus vanleenenianus TaxID=2268995 RepID=UPI003ECA8F25